MRNDGTDDPPTVDVGIIGLGSRGTSLLETALTISGIQVTALCTSRDGDTSEAVDLVTGADQAPPETYTSHDAMIEQAAIDAVIVATPWTLHVPMAITAMEAGVDVGLEVGPASSVEECWNLVETAERTGSRCMLLENCCYDRDYMAVMRMVRNGLFGEVVHCRCGYGHDIRSTLGSGEPFGHEGNWRGVHHRKRNGDLYPTHGIGPTAKCLGINRGNRFVSLRSTVTKACGLDAYTDATLDADHPYQDVDWRHGDVVTTMLECTNGETVLVTHDVSLPRPYSRMYQVQGTGGLWRKDTGNPGDHEAYEYTGAIHLEGESSDHTWEPFAAYRDEWEHPVWRSFLEAGVEGGHGGLDTLVLRDFAEAVATGARPPIDVYDTATWMALTPLTERSIANGGDAVTVPDFTNGAWLHDEPTFGVCDGE